VCLAEECRVKTGMKLVSKIALSVAALALTSSAAFSAELVELRNGFLVHVNHREKHGKLTRLYLDGGSENFVEVSDDQIVRSEDLPEPAPPPAAAPAADSDRAPSLEEIVLSACSRYGIDPDIVFSLIRAESDFDPKAVSRKGAQGLMQLMPQTSAKLGVGNPMDAAANVDGGTRYLQSLLEQYHYDLTKALAAYNAGPARVDQYHGVPPYRETITYINRIVRDLYARKIEKAKQSTQVARKEDKERILKP
jgi:soluble lytic murein transglycosylase-like protein